MRRILATACCGLWLFYGILSGLAHIHPASSVEQIHGLGFGHAHETHDPGSDDHDGARPFHASSSGSGEHQEPIYLTGGALKPRPKAIVVPIDLAGAALSAPRVTSEAVLPDDNREPHVPPSEKPPGLRAPPA